MAANMPPWGGRWEGKSQKRKGKGQQLVTKNQVRDMLNSRIKMDVEDKIFYSTYAGSASTTAGISCLSAITQGVASNCRTGDECHLTGLEFNFGFSGGDATNFCRIIIIQWLMNDSSDAVGIADIVANTAVPWLSMLSPYRPNRFKPLFDKIVSIGTQGTDAVVVKANLKLDTNISFNATAATGINHIYSVIVSDSSAATHPTYAIEGFVRYEDA